MKILLKNCSFESDGNNYSVKHIFQSGTRNFVFYTISTLGITNMHKFEKQNQF